MFGIISRPCRAHDPELALGWMKYMCGSCLEIKQQAGQLGRASLNNDAIFLAILVDAQSDSTSEIVSAGPCPFRGMRTAEVVSVGTRAAEYGAAVSLVLAGAKVQDDMTDSDRLYTKIPGLGSVLGHLVAWATKSAEIVELDFEELNRLVALEDAYQAMGDHASARQTIEEAYALVFGQAAEFAGRRENIDACRQIGAAIGSVASILDAVRDRKKDLRGSRFNLVGDIDPDALSGWVEAAFASQFRLIRMALESMGLENHKLITKSIDNTRARADREASRMLRPVGAGLAATAKNFGSWSASQARHRYVRVRHNSATRMSSCGAGCDCCDCLCCC